MAVIVNEKTDVAILSLIIKVEDKCSCLVLMQFHNIYSSTFSGLRRFISKVNNDLPLLMTSFLLFMQVTEKKNRDRCKRHTWLEHNLQLLFLESECR